MIGTLVNVGTIVTGSMIGSVIKKGIKEEYKDCLFTAMGLAAAGLGINSVVQNMPKSNYPVLFIVALALGSLIGTMIDIDGRFHRLVDRFSGRGKSSLSSCDGQGDKDSTQHYVKQSGRLAEGLSTGILLYCIGTLSILGPINSALHGDHTYLFTNATLDLVTSCVLASAYGIGMVAAAGVLLLWQGGIYLLACLVGDFMSVDMMTELSLVGGFLIASSGISILKIKEIKTINMLPCLAVPVVFFVVLSLF